MMCPRNSTSWKNLHLAPSASDDEGTGDEGTGDEDVPLGSAYHQCSTSSKSCPSSGLNPSGDTS